VPLFSNKFFTKKPSPRKTELFVTDKGLGPESITGSGFGNWTDKIEINKPRIGF
jgi:hypothetical protein